MFIFWHTPSLLTHSCTESANLSDAIQVLQIEAKRHKKNIQRFFLFIINLFAAVWSSQIK